MASIRLSDAARWTERPPLPHQLAAWNQLQQHLTTEVLAEFADTFRAGPPPKPPLVQDAALLAVPYFQQLDNAGSTGWRECFSSSAAMLAAYHTGITGITTDDAYISVRRRYGDTTDAAAHVAALESLGLDAAFRTTGIPSDLEAEINAQRPVATGWLHHGSTKAPTGGHWTVVIGYTPRAFVHHDPYGECDLIQGTYINHNKGRAITYSRRNWLPRWSPTPRSGWLLTAKPRSR